MVRQIVIAMVLSVALIVGFLLFMIRSTTGGDRLCSVGKAVLQDISGQSVEIGHCSVDPIGTRVSIENVRIGPADHPLFRADRLSAGIDHQGFLSGKVRIDQVEIVHPQVALDLSKPRPARAAEIRPPGAACLPDLGRLEIGKATLTNGEVHLLLPKGRSVDEKGMQAELHGDGEKLAISFSAASSTYADEAGETTADRTQVRGQFDLNAGTARLEAVDIAAPEGSVFAEGELSSICNMRGSASATVRADFNALHRHLLRDVENLGGTGTVRASVTFDGARFDATAKSSFRDLTVLRFTPGNFAADFRATPQALEVTRFDLPLESGKLSANGRLGLEAPYPLTADAKLDNLVVGELLERLGSHDLPMQLRASGTARLSGPLATEEGPRLDVKLDADVPEFGVFDRSFRRILERNRVRYIGFTKGSLHGTFQIGSHALELTQAHIAAADTDIDLSGTVHFDSEKGMALRFDARRVRLDELGPFGPARCGGVGELHGNVSGPYSGLDIDAKFKVRSLQVQGYDIGDVSASLQLDLGAHQLDVVGISATRGDSTFVGDAQLTFRGEPTLEARLSVDNAHMIDLIGTARERFIALSKLDGKVDALITGDIAITGPARTFNMDARFTLSQVQLYGQHFDGGILRATMRSGQELAIRMLELDRGEAKVLAKGQLELEDLSFKLWMITRGLRMAHIDALGKTGQQSTGSLFFSMEGQGTLSEPELAGKLLIHDWMLRDQPLATVELKLGMAPDQETSEPQLKVKGTITSPWPTTLAFPEHVPGRPWPLPPGSMYHSVNAKLTLSGDMPFTVNVDLDAPDIQALMPADKRTLHGGFAGALTVDGDLSHVADLAARLELRRLWVRHATTTLETEQTALVLLNHGRVELRDLKLRGGSFFHLSASGAREADGRLDFKSDGELDLSFLKEELADLEEGAGLLSIQLALTGTQSQPAFVGHANLDGVNLRLKDLPVALHQGSGAITFGKGAALIERFTADLNGGPLSLRGSVSLDSGYIPGALDVIADLGSIPLTWDDIPMVVSGSPELKREAAGDLYVLTGKMRLDKLRYTTDQDAEKWLLSLVERTRRPPTPAVLKSKKEDVLGFDLGMALGDVRIENNLVKAAATGDVTLKGTNRHYGLVGTITVTDAKAYVRSNEFKVSSAVLNFTDPAALRYNFDVHADSLVRNEYSVHFLASGNPQDYTVRLTSEPELSQADIAMLLTLGVTSRDFGTAGSNALSGVLLDAAYTATGIPTQVKRLLPKNDILRDPNLKLSSAYNPITQSTEPIAIFEGKLLRDDWTLQGQTSLLGHAGSTKATLDMKLRKNISASAQWNDDPSAPTSGDFGGDVRFHWESP